MTEFEVGDVILCTVDKITGTIVFVKIDGTDSEGSIITSEIAPGRIRNLRDYVVPKKKIICKIIRISDGRINLSLRRVTPKEQKEVREHFKQEKSSESILRSVLGDKAEQVIKEISQFGKIHEFLQDAKENPKELEKIIGKSNTEKILEILNTQKQKKVVLKKEIILTTTKSNGLQLIKEILENIQDTEIKYNSAGKYLIITENENVKKADNRLREVLKEIEQKAKQKNMEFAIKEK